MTNAHASKQHCFVGKKWPHSKMRKKRNKAKARARKAERAAQKATKKA
ncbi:hypothetical protein HZA40_02920 [Candidatus Peregrinibacteria bacterium]|nr:hypothetical protein [Candidatus Peregrinibacteria bacterium]